MPISATRIRRIAVAYLAASLAATATVCILEGAYILWTGGGLGEVFEYPEVALFLLVFSLAYILIFGLLGWGLLTVLKRRSFGVRLAVGGILGFVVGTFRMNDGPIMLYAWCAAGIVAAATFHEFLRTPATAAGTS